MGGLQGGLPIAGLAGAGGMFGGAYP